jgi:hypothetical protein
MGLRDAADGQQVRHASSPEAGPHRFAP